MPKFFVLPAALLVLGVAAGSQMTPSSPTRTSSNASEVASQMPQSPNSLPVGDRINAPTTTGAGIVGTNTLPVGRGF